jgi:hypothetical protein
MQFSRAVLVSDMKRGKGSFASRLVQRRAALMKISGFLVERGIEELEVWAEAAPVRFLDVIRTRNRRDRLNLQGEESRAGNQFF